MRLFQAAAFAVVLACAHVAAAGDAGGGDERLAQAIALGREGKAAYDAGRYAEALAAFEAAEQAAHSPVFLLYAARCQLELGRWLEALALYRRAAEGELAADAPDAWHAAARDARDEGAALEGRIPTLEVMLAEATGEESVTVDGAAYDGKPLRLAPGKHRVVVERGRAAVLVRDVELAPGARMRLELALPPVPTPPAPAQRPSPPPRPIAAPAAEPEPLRIAGYALLGAAGAGALAGAVAGGVAMASASDARAACGPDGICGADDSRRLRAERAAHASTACLAIAGGAAVAGVVLLLVPGRDAEIALGAGPSGLWVSGRL